MARKEIIDEITMKRAITRITYEIIERNKELDKLVLIGIKTRGVYLAKRIQERLQQLEGLEIPLVSWIHVHSVMTNKLKKTRQKLTSILQEKMSFLSMMCSTQVGQSVRQLMEL